MSTIIHAPRARLIANLLTLVLAAYGAWGWLVDGSLPMAARLALGLIALLAQQMANAAAAGAAVAHASGRRLVAAGALALVTIFASVTGHSVEHALQAPQLAARAGVRAEVQASIAAAEDERARNEAALRALPADIPGSRIRILQAPLVDAIGRQDARLAELHTELNALSRAPGAPHASVAMMLVSIAFWALAFAEPGFYWLLSALSEIDRAWPGVPGVGTRTSRPRDGTVPRSQRVSRGLAALIALLPGLGPAAAAPPLQPPDAAIHVRAATAVGTVGRDHGRDDLGQTVGRGKPPKKKAKPPEAAQSDKVSAVLALHKRGVSLRQMEAMLDWGSKSTYQRLLKSAGGS